MCGGAAAALRSMLRGSVRAPDKFLAVEKGGTVWGCVWKSEEMDGAEQKRTG